MTNLNLFDEPSDLRLVARVLDLIDSGTLVSDRSGRIVFADREFQRRMPVPQSGRGSMEFLGDLIGIPLEPILKELEKGAAEVNVRLVGSEGKIPARVKWLRQPDWLVVTMDGSILEVNGERLPLMDETVEPISSHGNELARRSNGGEEICRDWVTEDQVFLAASPQMAKIREQILHVAPVNVPVFIWGESGTGKEVLARMVHTYSLRRDRPFIKVNCAALPGELLESELFGYEQGAFTGAVRPKPGKFELANKGTIFLDEIAEMSSHLQSKLLHVLQDKQYARLGGRNSVHVDVRVIAATNVDVQEAISQGRMRDDLYYRLSVVTIHVPPLRERPADIPLLLRSALAKYQAEFGQEASEPPCSLIELAAQYSWPGNVRELENFAKRHVILGDAEESIRELQSATLKQEHTVAPVPNGNRPQTLKSVVRMLKDEAEARAIAEALKQTRWCRKDAARMLGISYKALLYKIRQLGLDPGSGKKDAATSRQPEAAKVAH